VSETPNRIALPLLLVLIDRNKTVISKAVPAHEAKVLKALFPGKVTTSDVLPEDMEPEGEFHANAHMELARLHACYRPDRDDALSAVKVTFPDAEALVPFGFTLGSESEVQAQPRNVSKSHGLAERRAAAAARKAEAKAGKDKKGGKAE
jgi:hypothetical protein